MSAPPAIQWKKILCPVDFSDRSRKALATAVALAQRDEAELSLVHVVEPIPAPAVPTPPAMPTTPAGTDLSAMQQEVREGFEAQLATWQGDAVPDRVASKAITLVGRPADELAAFAESEQVDLIVMASLGHGRWRRFLFGSVAERLLKLATCAVLVLPIEQ